MQDSDTSVGFPISRQSSGMCGIVGILRTDGEPVDSETLLRMATTLGHRGPDAMGSWVDGPVGLAHTRLSIIDLQGSQQPMSSPDGRRHLVFNGEILNYRELRKEIAYPYQTKGDTEVLLAVYEKYGPAGVTHLRGQFAYGIHDSETGETHLFRDRLGILPLYYYSDARLVAFASEIKALLPLIRASGGRRQSPRLSRASGSTQSPHSYSRCSQASARPPSRCQTRRLHPSVGILAVGRQVLTPKGDSGRGCGPRRRGAQSLRTRVAHRRCSGRYLSVRRCR